MFYHYLGEEKFQSTLKKKMLLPSAPFNSRVPEEQWEEYTSGFSFPVARLYTCCFFEQEPVSWKEYDLFDLLMEEFAGGDHLLGLDVGTTESDEYPILVRDHNFHSPKKYGMSPQEWKKRKMRDSRPKLREAWYRSAIPLSEYSGSHICPEVLIPFGIEWDRIDIVR